MRAQSPRLSAEEWANILGKKKAFQNRPFFRLDSILNHTDSAETFRFLHTLRLVPSDDANVYFNARINCLEARQLYQKNFDKGTGPISRSVKQLFERALLQSYESENDELIAFVSMNYGSLIYHFGETPLSVRYLADAVDLNDKLSGKAFPYNYHSLGDLLYRIREYRQSVYYNLKAVERWKQEPATLQEGTLLSTLNTIALAYHRLGSSDSAFIYYRQALQQSHRLNNEVWKGIVYGNMGQLHLQQKSYDTALTLLMADYRSSFDAGYYNNAGNSLQWAARTELAMGASANALRHIREALPMLPQHADPNYYRDACYTASEIFRSLGAWDSAYHYFRRYSRVNDSLEKVITLSSLAIAKARLNDEKSRYSIKSLRQKRNAQLTQRNILIASIILLAVFALLAVNRQRLKSRLKMERMEGEIAAAKEQLRMFRDNIVEKTNLLQKLEAELRNSELSAGRLRLIEELKEQTILTEENWISFRTAFEKTFPGFFTRLRECAPGITVAEQRMAALGRLELSNTQMAAMLGISPDSVRKSRLRLKNRLGLLAGQKLELFINSL